MPSFAWRAADTAGRTLRGVEDAESALHLERALGARGLYPLDVAPSASDGTSAPRRGFRTRRADVVEAVRYLATLADAGFPLDRALGAVARVVARNDTAAAVEDVRVRVRAGTPLGDALAQHPALFPRFAVGMVRAGERGGYLARALDRLAGQMEREQALRSRLLSALLYPAVMMVVGAGAVVLLFAFVLPRFVVLLGDTGSPIPRSTEILLGLGAFAERWWWAGVAAAVLGAAAIAAARATEGGRTTIDRVLLRLPVVGPLRGQAACARLARTLSALLAGGLPILPALEIAAASQADGAVAAEIRRAREEVRAGGRLAAALRRSHACPFLFVQMVEVGEEGGRLSDMLERAAVSMESGLERTLERLVRLVEPGMILFFGVVVGFVALSLLQAIYGIRADVM